MFRRIIFIVSLSLLITACGAPAATATSAPATSAPATQVPVATEPAVAQPLLPDTATSEPAITFTPEATLTPSITPTETQLPPLELPTEAANAPAKMVWDGAPTYLGDSTPGYSFRVTYDPDLWAVTADQFGFAALAHRTISACVISVTAGRGMPGDITIEHDVLHVNNIAFDVSSAFQNGVKKFVTYTGGDKTILTGFEVSFQDQADACIADAVTVLATLQSVPVSKATPSP